MFRYRIFQVTSYLDGSAIYGSSKEESEELRLFTGGLLRVQLQAGNGETDGQTDGALMIPVLTSFAAGDLLPADDNTIDCGGDSGAKCFKAGDVRVNEHIGLVRERKYELIILSIIMVCKSKAKHELILSHPQVAMHTLWMRQHNRIARCFVIE